MADKPNMTEMQKYRSGQPYDIGKLYQEMDDDFWDGVFDQFHPKDEEPVRMSWVDRGPWKDGKRRFFNTVTRKWRYQHEPPGGGTAAPSGEVREGGSEAIGMDKLAEHIGGELTDDEKKKATGVLAKLRRKFDGDDGKVSDYLLEKASEYLTAAKSEHGTPESKAKAQRKLAGVAELLTQLEDKSDTE